MISRIITENQELTNEYRIILRPEVSNIRNNFLTFLNDRIRDPNSRLPSTPMVESVPVIDRELILEINNTTSSERRFQFMESIINNQNNLENSHFLIEHSTPQVRSYLHNLLISSATNQNISHEDLYRIGNIFLYVISNIDITNLDLNDIIQFLRESMVSYNTNQIFSILSSQVPEYNQYLYDLRLATTNQLNERVNEFYNQMDERMIINRRRMLYTGIGFLGSIALSSFGIPPIGGLLTRTLIGPFDSSTVFSSNQNNSPINNVIRLRDIWDAILENTLKVIKK